MNKTFLDALLIDQALGALSSETEALLEAYLEKAPEQAAEMDHIRSAIDLAREAFHEEDPTTLPAFRAPARLRRRRLRKYSLQAAAIAPLSTGHTPGRPGIRDRSRNHRHMVHHTGPSQEQTGKTFRVEMAFADSAAPISDPGDES
jgi:anti-sigma factor RsiW